MSAETWISIDVETSGPAPSVASLLSIGACLVDRPEEGIEILVRPIPGLGWSDEAEAVHHLTRERLASEGLEPATAMERLAAWVTDTLPVGSVPVLVSFNAPFDWLFVADYCWRYLGHNPFGISALDLKALYMGRHLDTVRRWAKTGKGDVRRHYPIDLPHTHGALDDAREQAEICRRIRDGAGAAPGAVPTRISIVTLGVADLPRAVAFYERLGWERASSSMDRIAWFRTADANLGLLPDEHLAADADLPAERGRFGGVTLAINVESEAAVGRALDEAVAAGATLLKPATRADWGGVSGYFADPDGHPWEVAFNPGFPIGPDGRLRIP